MDASRRASWRDSKLQVLRLWLQVLRLRLRLQVSRLRLRVWRRDVPPGSCCAAGAQGPDGEQRRRQQRPGDDRGGGGCLCCCSASLLSQRPTHSACRPGRARPRGPSGRLPLWSVKPKPKPAPSNPDHGRRMRTAVDKLERRAAVQTYMARIRKICGGSAAVLAWHPA